MTAIRLAASALLAACAGWCSPALAFHSGGVGECDGCHTMHNSFEGVAADSDMPQYASG